MSNNASVNAELVIRIKDGTPQGAAAVVKSAEAMAQKSSTAIERASKKASEDLDRSNKQQRTSYEKLSQARETLGMRSEKTIQKEIDNTRRAYGQLASAGFAGAQEQERAYAAVQLRITRLTNEMGKMTTAQKKAADEAKRLAQIEADKQQRSRYEKLSQARETLGVRSEKTIQKEIDNTRRAYGQLASAGFAGAQEQERAYAAVQSRITRLTNEMGKMTTAQKKAADEAKRLAQIEADKQQRSRYEKLSQARETLGMRSEKTIQKEIDNTRRAYGQLASAGFAGAQEQERAYAAVQSRITRLTNEMGKLTTAQKKAADEAKRLAQIEADQARGARVMRGVAAGAVGVGAAAYTLKAPALQAMSFDERVGLLSNTAYAEFDKSGRKLGDAQIIAAIKKTISTGMTRDAALDALEKLIADDQVGGVGKALELLPFIGKVSTGSGSAGRDVAAMMGGFIGSGYAKDVAGAKRLMGLSSAAATAGAFEKNDMAKHLPALLPLAKVAGLTGEDGFKRLLVLLQQARTTAGSSDEAANNVKNLLSKLSSNDTANDFKKAGRGDLYKHLIDQRAKGVDSLTAWQNVIDAEIEKNPNLKPAIAKLKKAATAEEQASAIESIKGMAEGQSIGKYFQDMQAKGALFGLRNKDVESKVSEALHRSGSILDVDYESMADRAGVKTRVAKEQADMATGEAMDKLTPAIGRAAEAFSDLAAKHPLLIGTTTLTTTALAALAGAAGLTALSMGGKLPGGGAIGRAAGAIAGSPISRYAMKVGGVGAIGAMAGDWALGKTFGEESAITRYGSSMLTGAAAGATIGSIVPVLGTGIGALVGGGLGAAWEGIKDLLKPAEQKPVDVNAKLQVGLAPGLVLQSQSMNATGGNVYMNTGNLLTGAP